MSAARRRRRPVLEQATLFEGDELARTEARASEFVPTPSWVVAALVRGLREEGHPPLPTAGRIIEPAAGEGALIRALQMADPNAMRWTACELRAGAAEALRRAEWYGARVDVREGDYLTHGSGHQGEGLWITNPPWGLAGEFLEAMFAEADSGQGEGTIALHVPWAFVASPAFDRFVADLYPIRGRPYSFARETCWVVIGPGRGGRLCQLRKP